MYIPGGFVDRFNGNSVHRLLQVDIYIYIYIYIYIKREIKKDR